MSNITIHKKVSDAAAPEDDALIGGPDWNDEHVFTGGNLGALLYRDTAETDGANWLNSVAAGSVLVSVGAGSAPAWSTTPTVTRISIGDGDAITPALNFSADTNLGIVRGAADLMTFVAGGAGVAGIYASSTYDFIMRQDGRIGFSSSAGVGTASDVMLTRDAANTLALRNGSSTQTFLIGPDSSELSLAKSSGGAADILTLDNTNLRFGTNTIQRWYIDSAGFKAYADATYDIGASGANRPRNLFLSGNTTIAGVMLAADGNAAAPGIAFSGDTDTGFRRPSSDTIRVVAGGTDAVNLSAATVQILGSGAALVFSTDVFVYRAGAGALEQRNSTSPQTYYLYNTYTSGSVYERGFLSWSSNDFVLGTEHSGASGRNIVIASRSNITEIRRSADAQTLRVYNTTDGTNYERGTFRWSSNELLIETEQGGTGTLRGMRVRSGADLYLGSGGTTRWQVASSSGHLLASADNTYDIGAAAATRPRNVYVAGLLGVAGRTLIGANSTTAATGTPALDVIDTSGNNNYAIVMGRSTTDASAKDTALSLRHYTNAEEPFSLIGGAQSSTTNIVRIGGAYSNLNAATSISFHTAANNTTTTGTTRWTIDSSGHLLAGTDNSYDFGASGATRPRNIFVGNSVFVASSLSIGSYLQGPSGQGNVLDMDYTGAHTSVSFLKHVVFTSDNTHDIGASAANRPRNLYLSANLTINGVATFAGSTVNPAPEKDDAIYFAPQAFLEANIWSMPLQGGTTVSTFANTADANVPFSRVAVKSDYGEYMGDYIPVQAGETIYGEIWAMRASGATGTAGTFHYGIARYDKDKRPIATNLALEYFVANGNNVPTDGVWYKYANTMTLPTSHVVFNGSDGGAVRYIRPYLIVNYNSGTITTNFGGMILRRQAPVRGTGAVAFNGQIIAANGTSSSLSLTFSGANNAGIYNPGSNAIGFLNNGTEVMRLQGGEVRVLNSIAFSSSLSSADTNLVRDAANILALRNATTAQQFRVYNTYTSSTNYEEASFDWKTTSNVLIVGSRTGSGGGSGRTVGFVSQATGVGGFAGMLADRSQGVIRLGFWSSLSAGGGGSSLDNTSATAWVKIGEATSVATSGQVSPVTIAPTYNQTSGTANNTDLLINRTQTAVGSGEQLFLDAQVSGTTKFRITTLGQVQAGNGTTSIAGYGFTSEPSSGIYAVTTGGGLKPVLIDNGQAFITSDTTSGTRALVTSLGFGSGLGASSTADLILERDAANILAQRNGTNAQAFRIYNTYTSSTSYERLTLGGDGSNNILLRVEKGSGGGTTRNLYLGASSVNFQTSDDANITRWTVTNSGHFVAGTDNSYDIGASGATRPRNLYVANSITVNGGIIIANTATSTLGVEKVVYGEWGSANASALSGATSGAWIKVASVTINGAYQYFRMNARGLGRKGGAGSEGLPFEITVVVRNSASDIDPPYIQLRQMTSGVRSISDVRVVRRSGTGITDNVMEVWLQFATSWQDNIPVEIRYASNATIGLLATAPVQQESEITTDFVTEHTRNLYMYAQDRLAIGANSFTPNTGVSLHIANGVALVANGTLSAPAWAFESDTDTGVYMRTSGEVGIVGGGVGAALFAPSYLALPSGSSFGWESSTSGSGFDLTLYRDAADILAMRRTTNAQTVRVYNTYTNSSNYERASFGWTSNEFFVQTANAGTGSARNLILKSVGNLQLLAGGGATTGWYVSTSGHFFAQTDNTYDIGASGATRPRSLYLAANATVGGQLLTSSGNTTTPGLSFSGDPDTGVWNRTGNVMDFTVGGTTAIELHSTVMILDDGMAISWVSSGDASTGSQELSIRRDAANVLAQRNGTNQQAFRLYNTYTDASNYERMAFRSDVASNNRWFIGGEYAGTGSAKALSIGSNGAQWQWSTSGHFLTVDDNAYDIGASGATRPRNVYIAGILDATSGAVLGSGTSAIAVNTGSGTRRVRIWSDADGVLRFTGDGDTFNRLLFGGANTSYPALKRSSATLQVRLADDSAYATIYAANFYADSDVRAAAGGLLYWDGRSRLSSPSDGVITATNAGGTAFSRFQFGGTTTSFPALVRSGANLAVRLADDSAYSDLLLGALITQDAVAIQFGGTTSSFPALKQSSATLQVRLADDSGYADLAAGVITANGAGITSLNATAISTGTVATARLGSGTANSITYLSGDGTWKTVEVEIGTAGGYTHDQSAAANTTWTITHNLGSRGASVTVVDTDYVQLIPESITYDTVNQITVTFATDQAGYAYVVGGASDSASAPSGSDGQVQFNDGGAFNGDAGLTYDKTTDTLTIAGDLEVGGNVTINSVTVDLKPFMVFRPAQAEPPTSSYATLNTRGYQSHPILEFDASSVEFTHFSWNMPLTYAGGGLTVEIYWVAASATTGNVVWGVNFETLNGLDIDNSGFATEKTTTSGANATNGIYTKTTLLFSNSEIDGIAAGDPFRFYIIRRADNVSDTMAGDAQVLRVVVRET